ncbi:NADH-quinone oxidoreductase subunit NuoF [Desulfonatronum thioautotrophicum]|uniref:NADH-quinone oxidoreductase subunit NuoF n=1 Tax=Desulfonatronum thioautotrophicum TaxID=617001 RepID=UPI00069C9527|nr:NADH-quinone oxidoreductase subunit NuoF [Desulfonatronum thioautotrophicum]
MSFAEIQQKAGRSWDRFQSGETPRVLVGAATCGRAAGAMEVMRAFQQGCAADTTLTPIEIHEVGCLGMCYAEPLIEIRGPAGDRVLYESVTPAMVPDLIQIHLGQGRPVAEHALCRMLPQEHSDNGEHIPGFTDLPMIRHQLRIVVRNCGFIDPTDIDHYIARGGYSGIVRAMELGPEATIEEIKLSGLRGRGGAGFPTGLKWSFARKASGNPKYVICNADEGDPGAFMDRSVLESDPHAVLEGLLIAGYAIGANHGYVYCRAEYPLALERLRTGIAQMRANGLLGEDILGSGFGFDVTIKMGAGAFVCGEETSLMQSIEGRRGMPRPRPPFPAHAGLFGKPTNINNVETLAAVSAILEKSGAWYAGIGTEKSKGTKTFSLAGKITRTGLIEVPMGISLRTIIEDIGGGVLDGKGFKAVQTGGPSGGCVPAKHYDLPVDYEHLAQVGSIMGSGGMIVIDKESCMVDVAKYFLGFTENESCGKCVPCRMGTQHLLRLLTAIADGQADENDLETIRMIGDTMKKASLCGLGQTAPNPALTTLDAFMDEYLVHIRDHRCPAGVCKALISFAIDPKSCTGCMACAKVCPVEAITGSKKQPHVVDQQTCIRCGACRQACKFGAVLVE